AHRGCADSLHAARRAGALRLRRGPARRLPPRGAIGMRLWLRVAATIVGCYLLKLAGYLLPRRVLQAPRARRLVELLPVALLAALVVVEAIADGRKIDLDAARLAGVGAGVIAVVFR